MKNVFKKTLVASAIMAFAGAANAATYTAGGNPATATTPALTASAEGLADAGLIQIGTDFPVQITNVVTNVEQDVLEITFSGATIITTGADASAPVMAGYDFFDIPSPNVIRFRVATGGVAAGTATALTGVNLNATTSAVTMSTRVISLNPVIGEYDKGTGIVLDVKPQITVAATDAFDAVISTVANRKYFNTADTPSGDDDIVALTITNNAAYEYALDVTATENAVATHTIKGNFAYLRDADKTVFGGNANGALSSAEIASKVTVTATDDTFAFALSADNTTLTITQTAVLALDAAVSVDFDTFVLAASTTAQKNAATALSAADFTASVDVKTDDTTFSALSNAAVGSWTLDGSVVRVPYMVVGASRFGVILNVTNTGSQTGEIFLDIYDEAGKAVATGLVAANMSAPNKIVSVAKDVNDALVAAGYDLTKVTKFSVTITTNVPEDDVQVYAAYTDNTTSERAIVNNDSKVQTK